MVTKKGIHFEVDSDLKASFQERCYRNDLPASRVLRKLMRDYIQAFDEANKK